MKKAVSTFYIAQLVIWDLGENDDEKYMVLQVIDVLPESDLIHLRCICSGMEMFLSKDYVFPVEMAN